jgi:hypothetical protein
MLVGRQGLLLHLLLLVVLVLVLMLMLVLMRVLMLMLLLMLVVPCNLLVKGVVMLWTVMHLTY